MVLTRCRGLALLVAAFFAMTAPTAAHENHQKARTEQPAAARAGTAAAPAEAGSPGGGQQAATTEDDRPRTFAGRLVSWLGRTHPFAVHFPIALFPAALVALLLARRRGEETVLVRALIIVAGAASVIAGALGWLTAGFTLADPDWVHAWHRAIGTALALAGGAVAIWAWRRSDAIEGRAMVIVLAVTTGALLVQGWLGAALVHGMAHMML